MDELSLPIKKPVQAGEQTFHVVFGRSCLRSELLVPPDCPRVFVNNSKLLKPAIIGFMTKKNVFKACKYRP
jgi:hypothetical protein